MKIRFSSALSAIAVTMLETGASAAPKAYVFTGKITSNRGTLINIPQVGNVGCGGVGLSNLTLMSGPGGKIIPAPTTPPVHSKVNIARAYGCVAHAPGR